MKLNELSDRPGARQAPKRVGRGIGSGTAKTSGRGHKGQKSRSGVAIKGFEGGQMPIYRRLPKRGFSNFKFTTRYSVVNVADLESRFEANAHVTPQSLLEAGLIRNLRLPVKILGQGTLTRKLVVNAAGFSQTATDKIQAAGGEAKITT